MQINNQIVLLDKAENVLPKLKDNSIDLVITSPPYNLDIAYASYDDNMKDEVYLRWLTDICKHLIRVIKPDGSMFLNMSASSKKPWLPFELIVKLKEFCVLQNHIVWVKALDDKGHFKPVTGNRFLHRAHEHIFHLVKKDFVDLDRLAIGIPYADKSNIARRGHTADLRCRGNTWFIPYDTIQDKAERGHPAPFPVELPMMCMKLSGKTNPLVLDPFCGSGTTLLAAQRYGAKGVGIECDEGYIELTRRRLLKENPA